MKIHVSVPIVLPPETQTLVTVTTKKAGLVVIEQNKKFFWNNLCLVGTGIAQVQPNTDFKIIMKFLGSQFKSYIESAATQRQKT